MRVAVREDEASTRPRLGGLLRAWVWALVGFLVGEYGAGLALQVLLRADETALVMSLTWLPWILAALLCGVAAGLAVPGARERAWWTWGVAAAPIPVGAFLVTWWYLSGFDVEVNVGGLVLASLVQTLLAAAVATGIGLLRSRSRGSDAAWED